MIEKRTAASRSEGGIAGKNPKKVQFRGAAALFASKANINVLKKKKF